MTLTSEQVEHLAKTAFKGFRGEVEGEVLWPHVGDQDRWRKMALYVAAATIKLMIEEKKT